MKCPDKRTRSRGLVAALTMTLLASVGCGEQVLSSPEVTRTTGALGSTKAQQTIGSWNELVTKFSSDGNFLLTTDLYLDGKVWTPKSFSGTFDGGNHVIYNLTINVSNGFNAGFFTSMLSAIVRRVRFVNLTVTGQNAFFVGGLAGWASDSLIEDVGVEANVTAAGAASGGGILGEMTGGEITRSYSKGSVNSMTTNVGGLVGRMGMGESGPRIYRCYSTATVNPNTSASTVYAGGIAGYTYAAFVQEVYATGNVTGRGAVGGLVGYLDCNSPENFVLNHGIYRGNVTDVSRPPPAGWGGVLGGARAECFTRLDQLFWSRSADGSTASYVFPLVDPSTPAQKSYTDTELKTPITASGGVYNFADNKLESTIWNAGSSSQFHVLQGMPGGLTIQPR